MPDLTFEVFLPAPPKRIWELLTRFENYETWNPYLRIDGDAFLNARVNVTAHTSKGWSDTPVPARISMFEAEKSFELKSGLPWWSASTRFFHLEPHEAGTLLRHGVRFEGFLIRRRFARGKMLQRLRTYYENFGKALASAVNGRRLKNEAGNRHKRRAQRARERS